MGCALSISGQSVQLMHSEELGTRQIKIRSARNEGWSNYIYWKGCGRSLLPLAVPWIAFSLIRFDRTWHEIIRDNSFPVCMPFRFQNGIFFLKNSCAPQGSKTTSIFVRSQSQKICSNPGKSRKILRGSHSPSWGKSNIKQGSKSCA